MSERSLRKIEKAVMLLIISGTVWLLFFSCKMQEEIATNRVDSVYIQKLVPIVLPTDSSVVKALLACNINGRVVLNQLDLEATRNARLSFLLDSLGNLRVETIVKRDTLYVKSDSIRISEVITQFKYIEKPLSRWDLFILRFGNWMFGALCFFIVVVIVWGVYRIKKII